jgi:hypothetical protein
MIFEMLTGNPTFYYDEEQDTDDDNSRDNADHKIVNDEVDFPEDIQKEVFCSKFSGGLHTNRYNDICCNNTNR